MLIRPADHHRFFQEGMNLLFEGIDDLLLPLAAVAVIDQHRIGLLTQRKTAEVMNVLEVSAEKPKIRL